MYLCYKKSIKTLKITSILLLFTIISIISITPNVFADHPEVTIEAAQGSGTPGCEGTAEGCFIPGTATVDVGGTVIFSNTDSAAHTFTSGESSDADSIGAVFDSSLVMAGSTYEWSPTEAGTFPYFCIVHPWMIGTVIAQGETIEEEHVEEEMMKTQTTNKEELMTDINQIMAEINTSDGMVDESMTIDLTLTDLDGNGIEHITYNIKAIQGSEVVLDEEGHMHKGILINSHVTSVLSTDASDSMPVVITVESVGFGHDEQYIEVSGEIATKQVVPEFGAIAMMILVVAIISVVVVTAKSRLHVMPRI